MQRLDNSKVELIAKQIGFDIVGFADAEILDKETERLKNWLSQNFHGGMKYMEKNIDKRRDIKKIFPEAESVIALGVNYYYDSQYTNRPNKGKVSKYAWGKDYHYLMWEMLDKLETELKKFEPDFQAKSYVDTGPVFDSVWAYRAGLGWIGKNTTIINPEFGSWFFIGVMITNKKFVPSQPVTNRCGTCTACIDVCPTNALTAEYELNATKCISYLTIENKNEIPDEFIGKFDNWIFGCDICQDVCPWNKKLAKETDKKEFRPVNKELDLDMFDKMSNREFNKRFAESPVKRARTKGMRRNAEFLKRKNNRD